MKCVKCDTTPIEDGPPDRLYDRERFLYFELGICMECILNAESEIWWQRSRQYTSTWLTISYLLSDQIPQV